MSDFETLLAQGKYIDEGMQGLENMMYSKSMNMFQTGETEQFLMSLDESVLRCRQDLKDLKVKKQNNYKQYGEIKQLQIHMSQVLYLK